MTFSDANWQRYSSIAVADHNDVTIAEFGRGDCAELVVLRSTSSFQRAYYLNRNT